MNPDPSELVKDLQKNLVNFINAVNGLQAVQTKMQNITKLLGPNNFENYQPLPVLDLSQKLLGCCREFETDKAQLEKEHPKPDMSRIIMNISERLQFVLSSMTQYDYIEDRSESPMSSSFEALQQHSDNRSLRIRNTFKLPTNLRRWSECTKTEPAETIDSNRRWSMPSCTKTQSRFIPMMNKLAGYDEQTATNSDGVIEAIQLLSFKAVSRPIQQSGFCSQQQHFRSQQQPQRQRHEDTIYLGRYQQIHEE